MTKKPSTLPRGYRAVTPSLAVCSIPAAIAFYTSAFGAKPVFQDDETTPTFATMKIDSAPIFLTLGWPGVGHLPQPAGTPRATSQHFYTDNVDEVYAQSIASGAYPVSEPVETYWGERTAIVTDPFGHFWTLATRTEALNAEDLQARRKQALSAELDASAPVEDEASPAEADKEGALVEDAVS